MKRLRLALAALLLAVAAVAGAAWATTPPATHLEAHAAAIDPHPTPLARVAPALREAIVATEDERFYRHHGIDVLGVLRALPYDVLHLSFAEGASTITEQTAKLLYLGGNDHSPWRKLQDAALAVKLETHYSKERILAAYLNTAYFGGGAVGVGAAAEHWFGTTPRRLTLAEASLLAGLPQSPSAYDPVLHPAAARARQVAVLRSLVRNGFVTVEEAQAVLARPLAVRGTTLPPATGVRLAPGPAFVWWELALGASLAAVALAALLGARRLPAPRVARIGFAVLALAGAAAMARSFRVM